MATDTFDYYDMGISRQAVGTTTGDATALTVTLGWRPRHVLVYNMTDNISFELIEGMAATNTIKTVAAGTRTIDTTSAIVFTANGFTLPATTNTTGDSLVWVAY